MNISSRLNEYPFNAAVKVRIVSFNLDYDGELVITPIGSTEANEKELPVNLSNIVGRNDLPGFAQSKMLTLIEVTKLTDILYNVCPKYIISSYTKLGCYEPRNAILFYDENDQVFQYIEICFECRENETKPKKLNILDNFCSYGYDELKTFFEENGIKTEKLKK